MNVRVAPASLAPPVALPVQRTVMTILLAISFSHMLNDLMQSLLPAIYPLLKTNYDLDFTQIGLLTLTFQITASMLQPVVGIYTDRRPMPYSLAVGMGFTLVGLLLLSRANTFAWLLVAAASVGMGSSVFHPESSRVARMASGGRYGLAQSVFQVGGNGGQAIGPLVAAFIVVPYGQGSIALAALLALLGMVVLTGVGRWYSTKVATRGRAVRRPLPSQAMPPRRVAFAVAILLVLIFSKYIYTASLSTYYTFYLIARFHLTVQQAQVDLFIYLGAFAAGTLVGGPIGDRIGRKYVIWVSILGVLPFTLILPYANLFWTVVLTVPIGLILASAFSAILVYAQELMPGRVGTISGLFFGFAFGVAGVGAAVLGQVADHVGITTVYRICAFLPAIGLLTAFLPNLERPAHAA
jgi:FSR family fosmidomycin resistance protein-like MFS transporter